jgi:hypothetical protein
MYYDEDSYYQGWEDCVEHFGLYALWEDYEYDDEDEWYNNLPQTLMP